MKIILCAALLLFTYSAVAQVSTNKVTITVSPNGAVEVQTSGTVVTNAPPMPIVPLVPRSALLREMALRQKPPGTQRFIAVRVEERPETRNGIFSTNYIVVYQPFSEDTNALITWGANLPKSIRIETTWPTKDGDKIDLSPVPVTH